jgi:hypothetical protein
LESSPLLLLHIPRWLLGSTPSPSTTNTRPPLLFWGSGEGTGTSTWSCPSLSLSVPAPSPALSRGPVRVPRWAGGGGREFPSLPPLGPDSGRCFLRWRCRRPPNLVEVSGANARGLAGACVSLALYCSERPLLRRTRRRCVYKGEKP